MFVDEALLHIKAGRGGDGMISFRREKYVPHGGPSGGDGGKGGDVVLLATNNSNTLLDLRFRHHIRSDAGQNGGSKNKTGRSGKDEVLEVPLGTLIYNAETDELLADLTLEGERYVVAHGGDGGKGNQHFASARNRTPHKAMAGFPGDELMIRLELKLLADIGLVGYPSVGKSTLISVLSNARPKIAAYHFTTLVPNLGVVSWKDYKEYVIADIPGLIEGAHEGQGLGIQFLRHVERCNVLVHVLEVTPKLKEQKQDEDENERDPIKDYERLCHELRQFNAELLDRPQIIVLNKIDLPFVQEQEEELRAHFETHLGLPFMTISAASRIGLDELRDRLGIEVFAQRATAQEGSANANANANKVGQKLEWWEQ